MSMLVECIVAKPAGLHWVRYVTLWEMFVDVWVDGQRQEAGDYGERRY